MLLDVGLVGLEALEDVGDEEARGEDRDQDESLVGVGVLVAEGGVEEDHFEQVEELDLHDVVLVHDRVVERAQQRLEDVLADLHRDEGVLDVLDEQLEELAARGVHLRVLLVELHGEALERLALRVPGE